MEEERQARIGRLKWHCRRALLELDLIFKRFWERRGDNLDPGEEDSLGRLLELEDHELWYLVSGKEITTDPQLAGMIERLRNA